MSVQEIETIISQLPPANLAELTEWFEDFQAQEQDQQWDEQIARDMRLGRFDTLSTRAKEQVEAEQCRPLGTGKPLAP